MKTGFANKDNKSQYNWMFQLKSDKLFPFSAQKLSNCLAPVNEESPKGSIKIYCLFCKIPIFTEPCLGVSLSFWAFLLKRLKSFVD